LHIANKIAASKMDVVRVRTKNCQSDVDVNHPPWQLLARTRITSIFEAAILSAICGT